jgi:hypothetical protein
MATLKITMPYQIGMKTWINANIIFICIMCHIGLARKNELIFLLCFHESMFIDIMNEVLGL